MPERIGFIGMGIMGRPMTRNLLKKGFAVTVWNRSKPAMEEVIAAGAVAGSTPAEVARRSDITITMVSDTPDVRAVVFGPDGAAHGMAAGKLLVDMSTISPGETRKMAGELAAKGGEWVDAPVSGGDIGAINATLSIMVGGSEAAFARCKPAFEAMGKNLVHMGPIGCGQATKLCNQTLCAVNLLAVCEALVLGAKSGLDPAKLIQAVSGGAAGSWALSNLGPRMVARNWAPGFMVKLQQKDLKLVLQAADENHVSMPGTSLAHQLLSAIQAEPGGNEQGTAALVRALEKLAGTTIS